MARANHPDTDNGVPVPMANLSYRCQATTAATRQSCAHSPGWLCTMRLLDHNLGDRARTISVFERRV
jgi:hypothetical protein